MKSKNNYLHPDDLERLFNWAGSELTSYKWDRRDIEFIMRTAYWCLLRMNEALPLRIRDFDTDGWTVRLLRTKTERNVDVVIPPPWRAGVSAFLTAWDDRHPDADRDVILPGCRVYHAYRWLRRAGKALDLDALQSDQSESGEKVICHIFRKTSAKDMIMGTHNGGKGAPLPLVQKALRHKSLNVTARYVKMYDSAVSEWWDAAARGGTDPAQSKITDGRNGGAS